MSWWAGAVRSHTPQQHEFELALWTLRLIGELTTRKFGVSLSRSAVGRVMRTLSFTARRPLYCASQREVVLVKHQQNEGLPAIASEAECAGAPIRFADKASIRSDYHAGTT